MLGISFTFNRAPAANAVGALFFIWILFKSESADGACKVPRNKVRIHTVNGSVSVNVCRRNGFFIKGNEARDILLDNVGILAVYNAVAVYIAEYNIIFTLVFDFTAKSAASVFIAVTERRDLFVSSIIAS